MRLNRKIKPLNVKIRTKKIYLPVERKKVLNKKQAKMVEDNRALVFHVIKKYGFRDKAFGVNLDENILVVAGEDGLIYAVQHFDPKKEFKFSNYAISCIKGFMLTAMKFKGERILRQSSLEDSQWSDSKMSIGERMSSHENVEKKVLNKIFNEELIEILSKKLSSVEFYVIVRRFGLQGHREHSLEEVGKDINRSKERVRQIEFRALNKLKNDKKLKELFKAEMN